MVFTGKTVKRIVFGIPGNRFICTRFHRGFPVFRQDSTLEVGGFMPPFQTWWPVFFGGWWRSLHPKKWFETHRPTSEVGRNHGTQKNIYSELHTSPGMSMVQDGTGLLNTPYISRLDANVPYDRWNKPTYSGSLWSLPAGPTRNGNLFCKFTVSTETPKESPNFSPYSQVKRCFGTSPMPLFLTTKGGDGNAERQNVAEMLRYGDPRAAWGEARTGRTSWMQQSGPKKGL